MGKEGNVIELSDGKKATIGEFKGKHIMQSRRLAGDDSDKVLFAMIATCVTIDGKAVIMEEIDDMPGGDVLKLMGALSVNF